MCETKNDSRLKNCPHQDQRNIEHELFEFLYFQMLKQEPIKASTLIDFLMQIRDNVCMKNKLATLVKKLMIFPPPNQSSQKVSRNIPPSSSSSDSGNISQQDFNEPYYGIISRAFHQIPALPWISAQFQTCVLLSWNVTQARSALASPAIR